MFFLQNLTALSACFYEMKRRLHFTNWTMNKDYYHKEKHLMTQVEVIISYSYVGEETGRPH